MWLGALSVELLRVVLKCLTPPWIAVQFCCLLLRNLDDYLLLQELPAEDVTLKEIVSSDPEQSSKGDCERWPWPDNVRTKEIVVVTMTRGVKVIVRDDLDLIMSDEGNCSGDLDQSSKGDCKRWPWPDNVRTKEIVVVTLTQGCHSRGSCKWCSWPSGSMQLPTIGYSEPWFRRDKL